VGYRTGVAIPHPQELPHVPLSEFKIRKAKPAARPYKLYDGFGLFLLVNPNGSKLWRQRYRYLGRENLLTHGALILRSKVSPASCRWTAFSELLGSFAKSAANLACCRWTAFSELLG
jgi:hypothetical protein